MALVSPAERANFALSLRDAMPEAELHRRIGTRRIFNPQKLKLLAPDAQCGL
jgi:hypothetical protein